MPHQNGDELGFKMSRSLENSRIRAEFAAANRGYVYIQDVVPNELAAGMFRGLSAARDWGLKLCMGDNVQGLPPSAYRRSSARERSELAEGCYRRARSGFAFLREEMWHEREHMDKSSLPSQLEVGDIDSIRRFLEGREFLDFCGQVVGAPRLELGDVSYVRYGPGDFYGFTLGAPPQAEIGFMLDLTPAWELEWGGLLEFMNAWGGIERAYAPRYNALCLHSLHRHYSISCVAPFARQQRYTVCGKLHSASKS
jgi:Rps23 Pro-64 3,4-dihydroxylase Tpa1-like proline 4-hydroxylase